MYKPHIIQITRRIPLEIKKTLKNIDKDDFLALKQKLLEFCREPRSIHEIKAFLPLDTSAWAIRSHIVNPLIADGKLKYTIPYDKDNTNQMYINAEVELAEIEKIIKQKCTSPETAALKEKALEFCKEPKTIKEIMAYLEMTRTANVARRVLRPLMAEGKLRFRYPHDPYYINQQYVVAESELPVLSEENLLEFCRTPRHIFEIREHFEIGGHLCRTFIKPLVAKENLVYTEYIKIGKCSMQRMLKSNG